MFRANALFIVLVISLLIALISSSLILVSFHYTSGYHENLLYKRLIRNAQSGINYLLADAGELELNEERLIDLYGNGEDSIALKRMNWGIFDMASVRAFSNNKEIVKVIEYGYKPDGETKCAIYLTNSIYELILAGNTLIKGTCYLPDKGVDRSNNGAMYFTGTKLIHGEFKKSDSKLPELNHKIKEKILSLLEKKFPEAEFEKITELEKDTLVRSFSEKTILIFQRNEISRKQLSGNIIVSSDTLLRITKDNNLNDILIFARSVEIQSGFKGKVQIFAMDSIVVGENVELGYPSVLGVFQRDFKITQPFIKVSKSSRIDGIVFSSQSGLDLMKQPAKGRYQTMIHFDKGSFLHGLLYADGYADINGIIHGTVLCNKFWLKTPDIQENCLFNTTIDVTKLSPNFIGSSLLTSEKKKRIIKWME
ncbi:hypothetical protein [Sporocytophaga myxococcoides]|uniref:hypothetical protein n=1 Tax=Sporocytophaga myxococcoides TaxID=153721 RepID=UPI00048F1F4E|nr:hypothetical protein [Sporocytophaga myxococcoides]